MPNAYGYIRVSKPEEETLGVSLPAQEQQCRQFHDRQLARKGVHWAELLVDDGVSAFKKPLPRRKEGGKLISQLLQPGDHLIVTKFDRAFRNMADFVHCFQFFESREIHLHLLDCPFEYTTASGTGTELRLSLKRQPSGSTRLHGPRPPAGGSGLGIAASVPGRVSGDWSNGKVPRGSAIRSSGPSPRSGLTPRSREPRRQAVTARREVPYEDHQPALSVRLSRA